MDAPVAKADSIGVKTLLKEGDLVVKERLRVILDLVIAVGRREGLLGKDCDTGGNIVGKEALCRKEECHANRGSE
jgi:hypothetical protein